MFVVPVIKGLPFLVLVTCSAFFIANRIIGYMPEQYQATAIVKFDDQDDRLTDFVLFSDDTPKDVKTSNFLTEVELFKSKYLQRKALEKLDFDVSYFRIGQVRETELHAERPFTIDYQVFDESFRDRRFYLEFWGKNRFRIYGDPARKELLKSVSFGKKYTDPKALSITIIPNDSLLKAKPSILRPGDVFAFEFNSLERMLSEVNADRLYVKPVDKDVHIIKIYYKHRVPEKAAYFVNALANAYLEIDQENRIQKASRTLEFINGEIERIKVELIASEKQLSVFRRMEGLIDIKQETDALLKQINNFDFQKMNLDLKEIELKNLYEYLTSRQSLSDFSPDFETINDDVLMHTYLKLKNLELERTDLLTKYPPGSTEISAVNAKVEHLKRFTLESIKKKVLNISGKREEIHQSIGRLQNKFKSYPDKERRLAMLTRKFNLHEQTFEYLTKKRTQLGIVRSSKLSFHKVIDYATIPERPVAPNRPLLLGLSVLLAGFTGLILVYGYSYFMGRVDSPLEVEESMQKPLLATVGRLSRRSVNPLEPFLNLYSNLNAHGLLSSGKVISFCSTATREGKTFITANLGKLLASFGKKVLLIDMNMVNPRLHEFFEINNAAGVDKILQYGVKAQTLVRTNGIPNLAVITAGSRSAASSTLIFSPKTESFLQTVKREYDVVLIDTAATGQRVDAAGIMRLCDASILVIRQGRLRKVKVNRGQQFAEKYNVKNVNIVYNQG